MAARRNKETDNFRANLRELVRLEGHGSVTRMAEYMGIHRVTMSEKIHGRDPLALPESEAIASYFGRNLSQMLVHPREFKKSLVLS